MSYIGRAGHAINMDYLQPAIRTVITELFCYWFISMQLVHLQFKFSMSNEAFLG